MGGIMGGRERAMPTAAGAARSLPLVAGLFEWPRELVTIRGLSQWLLRGYCYKLLINTLNRFLCDL